MVCIADAAGPRVGRRIPVADAAGLVVVGALMPPVRLLAELLLPWARRVTGPLVPSAPGGWPAW